MDKHSHLERRALGAGAGKGTAATSALSRSRVQGAQARLAAQGFDPGVRHGELDDPTRQAIGAFQRSRGLPQTHTIDSKTDAALKGGAGAAMTIPTTPAGSTTMSSDEVFKGTTKRVPMVFTAALTALQVGSLQLTPQYPFRGEALVVDPGIAASSTVQIPSVGPNPQVAGGSTNANLNGAMFPPTQTKAMEFGMDISEQGNQMTLNFASLLTSTNMTFNALVFGVVVRRASADETQKHRAAVAAGLAPAGNYSSGMIPAASFVGA